MKIEGNVVAKKGTKVCLIASRFNEFISSKLLSGAIDELKRHGVSDSNIDVVWCAIFFNCRPFAQELVHVAEISRTLARAVVVHHGV